MNLRFSLDGFSRVFTKSRSLSLHYMLNMHSDTPLVRFFQRSIKLDANTIRNLIQPIIMISSAFCLVLCLPSVCVFGVGTIYIYKLDN